MNNTRNAAVVVHDHAPTPRATGQSGRLVSLPWLSFNRTGIAIFLYGTLAAFLVAFILYPAQHLVASTIDLNGFGALARSIAQGHGFSDGLSPTMRRAPLYPFIGAAFMKAFGSGALYATDNVAYRPMLAANCLTFGLTCLTIWAIARRLFSSRVALIAALVCPFVPQAIRYVGMTEVETLMGLLVALLVYTGLNLLERPSVLTGVWFGLTVAAATLTKPVAEYYVVAFLVLAWIYWRTQPGALRGLVTRPRVLATSAVLVCFILALAPWTLRNMSITNGQFTGISSDGPGSILRGYVNTQPRFYLLHQGFDNGGAWEISANSYEAGYLRQHGMRWYTLIVDSRGNASYSPPLPKGKTPAQMQTQKDRIETGVVKQLLLHQPGAFLKKVVIQLATFWYLETTRLNSLAVGGIALLVLIFAAIGLLYGRPRRSASWPIVAIVVYMNVVYAVSLALGRYSSPLFPVLLILAVAGVAFIGSSVSSRLSRVGWELS